MNGCLGNSEFSEYTQRVLFDSVGQFAVGETLF